MNDMTTLKITDREEVLRRVLTEAFKPRFSALHKSAEDLLRKLLAKDHPRFEEVGRTCRGCRCIIMPSTCRAVRVNDQMICPCGRQWDIIDPEPPECVTRLPTKRRAAYLEFIERLFGIEGVKK
jgi:hypothetical protein